MQCAAVRLAVEMDLPQVLVAGSAMTAAELAQKSGADQTLIGRITYSCIEQLLRGEWLRTFKLTLSLLASPGDESPRRNGHM